MYTWRKHQRTLKFHCLRWYAWAPWGQSRWRAPLCGSCYHSCSCCYWRIWACHLGGTQTRETRDRTFPCVRCCARRKHAIGKERRWDESDVQSFKVRVEVIHIQWYYLHARRHARLYVCTFAYRLKNMKKEVRKIEEVLTGAGIWSSENECLLYSIIRVRSQDH